jgi:hypothetical protein
MFYQSRAKLTGLSVDMNGLQVLAKARDAVSLMELGVITVDVARGARSSVGATRMRGLGSRTSGAFAHGFGHACRMGDRESGGKVRERESKRIWLR